MSKSKKEIKIIVNWSKSRIFINFLVAYMPKFIQNILVELNLHPYWKKAYIKGYTKGFKSVKK